MMRKIFVSAMITAALCSLAISAAPALGFEFEAENSTPTEPTSSTKLVIPLGTAGSVECSSIKVKVSPVSGLSETLKVKTETYTSCFYNDNAKMVSEFATFEQKCPVLLESEKLEEVSGTEFAEGLAEFNCNLKINTSSCSIVIAKPASSIRVYEWVNTDSMSGHYKSLLELRLKKLKYTISSGCGSSGTSGEFDVSVPIEHVIVVP